VAQVGVGWILNTLPQLEESVLYDQFKAGRGVLKVVTAENSANLGVPNDGIGSTKERYIVRRSHGNTDQCVEVPVGSDGQASS